MSVSELRPEAYTVIEQWHGNDMIRYIRNTDGSKTVLEHRMYEDRPFVQFYGRGLTELLTAQNDSNETR